MKRGLRTALAVFLLALGAEGVRAAETWTISVAADGTLSRNGQNIPQAPPGPIDVSGSELIVSFDCSAPVDCSGIQAQFAGADPLTQKSARAANAKLTGDPSQPSQDLIVDFAGKTTIIQLSFKAGGPPQGAARLGRVDLAEALRKCSGVGTAQAAVQAATNNSYVSYDQEDNQAAMIISPVGGVFDRFEQFDENDLLTVWVYGHIDLVSVLHVERTSAIRTTGLYPIVGDAEAQRLNRQSLSPTACVARSWSIGDFAPGESTITIKRVDTNATLGTVSFVTNTLYAGLFSMGGIWTDLSDPELGVASNGTDDVIIAREQGEEDFEYALFFTPFVWGKRDLEKPPVQFYHRLNPTIGIALDDVEDNAIVGVSIDLPRGFVVTWGQHFRRIGQLDPAAGLSPGDSFTGTAAELPIVKNWEDDTFVGFSIDLRAAVKLFRGAFTQATNN